MSIKGFLERFDRCYVNGQPYVKQSSVEFLWKETKAWNPKDNYIKALKYAINKLSEDHVSDMLENLLEDLEQLKSCT